MEKNEQQLVQLPPNELQLFEQVSTRYDAVIRQGVTLEDMLVPGFWAHHAIKLRPMDEIRARAEDGTWVAHLLVLDCSRTWAKVVHISMHRLTTADQSLTQASAEEVKAFVAQHKVVHRAQHKWSVVRNADSAILQEGIGTKDEAMAWLEAHARTVVGGKLPAKAEPVAA